MASAFAEVLKSVQSYNWLKGTLWSRLATVIGRFRMLEVATTWTI
jgi:hypothetical protein